MPALVEKQEEGRRFRPGLAATLFTLAAVAIMVGLGTWQVERLAWKNALIERIESGMRAAPAPLPAGMENPADWDFRRVSRHRPVPPRPRTRSGRPQHERAHRLPDRDAAEARRRHAGAGQPGLGAAGKARSRLPAGGAAGGDRHGRRRRPSPGGAGLDAAGQRSRRQHVVLVRYPRDGRPGGAGEPAPASASRRYRGGRRRRTPAVSPSAARPT